MRRLPREAPRSRRGFDHLFVELSLAVGQTLPRYPLWLRLASLGFDPERLDAAAASAFCEEALELFLAEYGLYLHPRELRRVRRRVRAFDPERPTPYERMAALGG
jgi:hypothetical protein